MTRSYEQDFRLLVNAGLSHAEAHRIADQCDSERRFEANLADNRARKLLKNSEYGNFSVRKHGDDFTVIHG